MDKFERITTEPGILQGEPSIRGLAISVSEVVKRATAGQSVGEILAAYPDLEAEDVHQALAFGVNDLSLRIIILRGDGRSPLASIKQGVSVGNGDHLSHGIRPGSR